MSKRVKRVAAVLAVALAGMTANLHAQQMPEPVARQLADGVYYWFAMTYGSLVVISGEDVLVTEPVNGLRAPLLQGYVATLTGNPISHVVLTHEHYDHVGGTGLFPDATVHCHVNCRPIFELAEAPFDDVPESFESYINYKRIMVGDTPVELHHLGPGDGDATTVVYLPQQKIVLTADMYEERALTGAAWVDDKNFTGTRKILNVISEWELEHALTAHSPSSDPQVLYDNVRYYNDLFDAVMQPMRKAVEEGGPLAVFGLMGSLPASVELPRYSDWANYDTALESHARRMMFSIFHGD